MNIKKIGEKDFYELDDLEVKAIQKASKEVVNNTYPTPSKGYTTAVMTKSGNIYPGISYSSDTGTLTMHCEAVALSNAALHGEKEVIAIEGPNCHICKQLIWESSLRSGIDINCIIEEDNVVKQIPISTLMPYAWPEKLRI
ncbi:MAG: hypothetical protein WCK31_03545 [bacterium]